MIRSNRESEEVVDIRRKTGKLRVLITSAEHRYLILDQPGNEEYFEKGAVLGPKQLEELESRVAREAGLVLAYNLLSRRDRSVMEIERALADENIEKREVIDYIVETLRRHGYLNDRRLASGFVEYRKKHRPAGPGLIRKKLREAGIDEEIIDMEVERNFPENEEKKTAFQLAEKKLASMRGVEREASVRRLNGFLTRKGFSRSVINEICARVLKKETFGE
ncbi:MAG: regulatory protein RecX [Candidatus Krumholzibacteriota bacterium]|nr:regulatory protein RecX [Candidatus Krumholzibacteriota bacterium]